MKFSELVKIPYIGKMLVFGISFALVEASFFLGIGMVIQQNSIILSIFPETFQLIVILVILKIAGSNALFYLFSLARFDAIKNITLTCLSNSRKLEIQEEDVSLARRLTEDVNTFVNVGINNIVFLLTEFVVLQVIFVYMVINIPFIYTVYLSIGICILVGINYFAAIAAQLNGTFRRKFEEKRLKYTLSAVSEPEWIFSSASRLSFNYYFGQIMAKISQYGSRSLLYQQMPRLVIEALGLGLLGLTIFLLSSSIGTSDQIDLAPSGVLVFAAIRAVPIISKISVYRQAINMNKAAIQFVMQTYCLGFVQSQSRHEVVKNSYFPEVKRDEARVVLSETQFDNALEVLNITSNKSQALKMCCRYLVTGESGIGKTRFLKLVSEMVSEHLDCTFLPQKAIILDFHLRQLFEFNDEKYLSLYQSLDLLVLINELKSEVDLQKRVTTLSAGEIQRLGLAFTIVQRPDVILLDEPIANLPAKYKIILPKLLNEYAPTACVIAASHQNLLFDDEMHFTRF